VSTCKNVDTISLIHRIIEAIKTVLGRRLRPRWHLPVNSSSLMASSILNVEEVGFLHPILWTVKIVRVWNSAHQTGGMRVPLLTIRTFRPAERSFTAQTEDISIERF